MGSPRWRLPVNTDCWANAGESGNGKTTLVFVREIDRQFDSAALMAWLKNTTLEAARFAQKNRQR